jgi:predicted phosphodiesterase
MPKKKTPIMLLASTLILSGCAYNGKSKTFVSLLEKTGVHEIQKGLEGIIKSNSQVIQDLEQKQKNQWLRFVVIGDTISNQNITYRNLLAKISQLNPPPEFIVNLGDFTRGKSEQYSYYLDTIKNYPCPIIHVMGNHEIDNGGERISRAVFGETDFFLDYNNLRMIFMGTDKQGFAQERLEWLEDRLKDAYPAKKIFLTHRFPVEPFKELFHGIYSLFVHKQENEEKMLDLLDENNVAVAFYGHMHRHYEKIYRGILMVMTGGGGQRNDLDPRVKEPLSTKENHFTLVDIMTEGEIRGVLTCINKNNNPLFISSFYQSGNNGNNDEVSTHIGPYQEQDKNFTRPLYISKLYREYQEKNSSKK